MEPRKKGVLDTIMYLMGVAAIILLFLHLAVAYDAAVFPVGNTDKLNMELFLNSLMNGMAPEHIFKISWQESSPRFLGYGLFISGLMILALTANRKKYINGKEYGTSQWAGTDEIKHLLAKNVRKSVIAGIRKEKIIPSEKREKIQEAKLKYTDNSNIIYTAEHQISMYNFELNANCIIIGGSGSGKTRGYVLPNILQCTSGKYSPSIVVTDPKGEILEKVGCYLTSAGYEIKVLNLKELDCSCGYNPFSYILPEKYEEQLPGIVDNIMKSRQEDNKSVNKQDPFWDEMAAQLLKALFFAVYEGFPEEERNIITVMKLFRWFEVTDDDDRQKKPTKLDIFFSVFSEDEEITKQYGELNTNPALRSWEDFRTKCKGKTAQGVTATALSKLAPFDESQIRKIFSCDEMELDQIGEKKMALFVVLPPTSKRYNFIVNVLYTQLFEQLEYCATVKHNQQLPVPVRFILDEFYNTGKIPEFENILSYARSFGIGITIILQSLDQIKEMYEKSWGTIMDNCDVFLYLGKIRHYDTLKYISDLLGKGTFDKKNYSRSKGRQSSSSTNFDKIGRELMDPSEIQRMKKNKCLLFINGYNPVYADKYDFKKHKNYKRTSDFSKKNSYKYELTQMDKSPHGEENHLLEESSFITPPIILNTDSDEIMNIFENNILDLDLESGEEVTLCEDENAEYELIKRIIESEEEKEREMKDLLFSITPPIDVRTDSDSIENVVNKMTGSKEDINFCSSEYGEEEQELMVLEEELQNLSEDIVNDKFLKALHEADLNICGKGGTESIDLAI